MDRLLSMLPKNLMAFLAIAGGTAFIIFAQPPHTLCDSQLEVLQLAQKSFLAQDPRLKKFKGEQVKCFGEGSKRECESYNPTSTYERLRDRCKMTNNPGGCYELFHQMKTL